MRDVCELVQCPLLLGRRGRLWESSNSGPSPSLPVTMEIFGRRWWWRKSVWNRFVFIRTLGVRALMGVKVLWIIWREEGVDSHLFVYLSNLGLCLAAVAGVSAAIGFEPFGKVKCLWRAYGFQNGHYRVPCRAELGCGTPSLCWSKSGFGRYASMT